MNLTEINFTELSSLKNAVIAEDDRRFNEGLQLRSTVVNITGKNKKPTEVSVYSIGCDPV